MIFLLLKNEILCSCRYMLSTICGVTGLKRHAPNLLKSKCKTRQQIFFSICYVLSQKILEMLIPP